MGVRLTWPGRGGSVIVDRAGRWRLGARASGSPRLAVGDTVGTPAAPPSLLVHGEAHDALTALGGEQFRLCYIDPPYNTGGDKDGYTDRTSHAIWLTCLEERLALARRLLAPGGFLVVHVNEVEQAHLRVLCDETWGEAQRVAQIAWQRSPDRTVLGQGTALVPDHVEYLLVYSNGAPPRGWPRPGREGPLPARTLATYGRTLVPGARARLVDRFTDGQGEEVRLFAHASYALTPVPQAARLEPAIWPRLMRLTNQQSESTFQQALLARMPDEGVLYRAEFVQRRGKHQGPRTRWYLNGNVVLWLADVARLDERGQAWRRGDLDNFWPAEDLPVTGLASEGGVRFRRGKKPEALLERVIGAFSRPGDRVLDFFAGSGTTAAVAHRLGRGFVTVEHARANLALCHRRLRAEVARSGGGFQLARVIR
jgi:adenine-specific DNA-methyltransferase